MKMRIINFNFNWAFLDSYLNIINFESSMIHICFKKERKHELIS